MDWLMTGLTDIAKQGDWATLTIVIAVGVGVLAVTVATVVYLIAKGAKAEAIQAWCLAIGCFAFAVVMYVGKQPVWLALVLAAVGAYWVHQVRQKRSTRRSN